MRANLFWSNDEQGEDQASHSDEIGLARSRGIIDRDHSSAQRLAGLSTGIWPVYDGGQSLRSLERARNLAANL
jgi:hypothetical protein